MADKIKFVVFSLGCKVNQYEGSAMIEKLKENGFDATDRLEYADYYIINTCSVTAEADKKSRQCVSRMLKFNKNAKIYVFGCSSENNSKQYLNKPNIVKIFGSFGKISALNSIMSDIVHPKNDQKIECLYPPVLEFEDDLTPELTKSRAYIKVQDGCNNFCSYCIIPYIRGRSRSRNLDSIVNEVRSIADKTKEIVITGINVSDYGRNIGLTLVDLVKALGEFDLRKRFGSLECTVISDELLLAMKEAGFCDSFHLSMQSGCDNVLKKMNRHYTASEFLQKIDLIRKYFPDAGITTDIIIGFPEETDDDFKQTLQTVERAGFLDMHVFPYSVRPGTRAAKMTQVDPQVTASRVEKMKDVKQSAIEKFIQSQIGKHSRVFVEENEGEYNVGHTSNFIKVYTHAPIGSYINHEIKKYYKNGAIGEPENE